MRFEPRHNGQGAHGAPARSGAGRRGRLTPARTKRAPGTPTRERRAGVRGGAPFNSGGLMSNVETPDRQTMWFWSMLAVLGAILAIVAWWQLITGGAR